MAEASGLVLGAVALASLFSTCIEMADYIRHGREYPHDYERACMKMDLLKARLATWGESLEIRQPPNRRPGLSCWSQEHDIVQRSLLGIKDTLQSACFLADKYRLSPQNSKSTSSPKSKLILRFKTNTTIGKPPHLSLFWRRTTWALHDKQKFDIFLGDLDFLIGNLEQVILRIKMPTHSDTTSNTSKKVNETLRPMQSTTSMIAVAMNTGNHFSFKRVPTGSKARFLQGNPTDTRQESSSPPNTFEFDEVEGGLFIQSDHDQNIRDDFYNKANQSK